MKSTKKPGTKIPLKDLQARKDVKGGRRRTVPSNATYNPPAVAHKPNIPSHSDS
jgi:hypothetical protein